MMVSSSNGIVLIRVIFSIKSDTFFLKQITLIRSQYISVCGGEISVETYGTIASPGSPGNYPPNRDCIWQLSAPPGKRIQLHFFTMQLESHETCQFDYLAVS